jgi:hypothetical protein
MQATDITNLQMRVCVLEDQLNLIQDTIELDSTRWEISRGTLYEEEISNIFTQAYLIIKMCLLLRIRTYTTI